MIIQNGHSVKSLGEIVLYGCSPCSLYHLSVCNMDAIWMQCYATQMCSIWPINESTGVSNELARHRNMLGRGGVS